MASVGGQARQLNRLVSGTSSSRRFPDQWMSTSWRAVAIARLPIPQLLQRSPQHPMASLLHQQPSLHLQRSPALLAATARSRLHCLPPGAVGADCINPTEARASVFAQQGLSLPRPRSSSHHLLCRSSKRKTSPRIKHNHRSVTPRACTMPQKHRRPKMPSTRNLKVLSRRLGVPIPRGLCRCSFTTPSGDSHVAPRESCVLDLCLTGGSQQLSVL